ncbi:MAG: tetratricopeptide repeat protein [Novosphingobium sp.]|uniref:tetratricopeptide repeat protein n=1 Tax=Novosphingobium sp. TaxID=1874826 RepID=UPI0030192B75
MKRLTFPVLALSPLALALMLGGCGADPKTHAANARKEFAAHDYLAAQTDLAAAMAAMPDDPALLELHARNALAMGDGIAAGASLDRLGQLRRPADYGRLLAEAALLRGQAQDALAALGADKSAPGLRLRGLVLLAQGNEPGALEAFNAGLAAEPNHAPLLASLARLKLMGGNTPEARGLADRALAAERDLLDAMLVDGQVATAEGRLGQALAAYARAAKAYPGNLAALTGQAGILGDLGRTDELTALLAGFQGRTTDGTLAYLKARAASAKGDWSGTRDILQANEDKLKDRDDANVLYAQALTQLGQPEQARSRLVPMLSRHPESLLLRRELAKAQLAGKDAAGAVQTLLPFARSKTASVEDLRLLANAAEAAGDPEAAFFAARARYPSPQSLGQALGAADAAMKAGNWGNAIKAYEQILALTDGRSALVLNNMAWAQSQVGNKEQALAFAQRAIAVAPEDPSVMDTLGWLLHETGGNRTRALDLLRRAAQKAPQNATIRSHFAEAQRG